MNAPEEPAIILAVDDVPANLKLLTNILTGHAHQVRPASNGQLALRSAAVETPDLVLLDVRMPDMDGYEVCRRLKADEKCSGVPVIFISALDDTEDKVVGFQAGGVDYVTKPFQAQELLSRVDAHLSLQRLRNRVEDQNTRLKREIAVREAAEQELLRHKAHLEELVAERTATLEQDIAERRRVEKSLDDCLPKALGPEDYVVIMTRGHLHDRSVLAQALRTRAGYVGMIS